jgi:hypothetical protein
VKKVEIKKQDVSAQEDVKAKYEREIDEVHEHLRNMVNPPAAKAAPEQENPDKENAKKMEKFNKMVKEDEAK